MNWTSSFSNLWTELWTSELSQHWLLYTYAIWYLDLLSWDACFIPDHRADQSAVYTQNVSILCKQTLDFPAIKLLWLQTHCTIANVRSYERPVCTSCPECSWIVGPVLHRVSVVQRVSSVGCFVRQCSGPSVGFTYSQS